MDRIRNTALHRHTTADSQIHNCLQARQMWWFISLIVSSLWCGCVFEGEGEEGPRFKLDIYCLSRIHLLDNIQMIKWIHWKVCRQVTGIYWSPWTGDLYTYMFKYKLGCFKIQQSMNFRRYLMNPLHLLYKKVDLIEASQSCIILGLGPPWSWE